MKKLIIISLLSTLMYSLCGCAQNVDERLNGTWHNGNQEITISDSRVEIKGYYELDGERLAGTIEPCELKVLGDNQYQLICDNYLSEVSLEDDTLIVNDKTYTRY